MNAYEPFVSLAVALGVGLLIGLQRQQSAAAAGRDEEQGFIGGIRTHPLFALAGALSMLIAKELGPWFVGVTFIVLTAPLLIAYYIDVTRQIDRGITSETAFFLTFMLGALAVSENIITPFENRLLVVAALAVTITGLLSLKAPLHQLAERATQEDVAATIKFLVLAVIVLPLLPNQAFGPLQVLNPFNIGLMIVLMAGVSFVGYLLIRVLGAGRGLGLTGLVGGLVSSTAVTLAFAGKAKREPAVVNASALAILLASTMMLLRVIIEVAAVNAELLPRLAPAIAAMMLGGFGASFWLYRRSQAEQAAGADVKFHNPFELGLAVKFGLLFALVLLATKAATVYLGPEGTYVAAALAGLTDMDAITLSMARLSREGLDYNVATTAIFIGAAANTVVKGTLAVVMGGWQLGSRVLLGFLVTIAAGAAAIAALRLYFA